MRKAGIQRPAKVRPCFQNCCSFPSVAHFCTREINSFQTETNKFVPEQWDCSENDLISKDFCGICEVLQPV